MSQGKKIAFLYDQQLDAHSQTILDKLSTKLKSAGCEIWTPDSYMSGNRNQNIKDNLLNADIIIPLLTTNLLDNISQSDTSLLDWLDVALDDMDKKKTSPKDKILGIQTKYFSWNAHREAARIDTTNMVNMNGAILDSAIDNFAAKIITRTNSATQTPAAQAPMAQANTQPTPQIISPQLVTNPSPQQGTANQSKISNGVLKITIFSHSHDDNIVDSLKTGLTPMRKFGPLKDKLTLDIVNIDQKTPAELQTIAQQTNIALFGCSTDACANNNFNQALTSAINAGCVKVPVYINKCTPPALLAAIAGIPKLSHLNNSNLSTGNLDEKICEAADAMRNLCAQQLGITLPKQINR